MKKIFKHILSAAALLVLTASAAFAADDNKGVVANKSVKDNGNGSYTLTLEAYATGEAVTTVKEEAVPLDIVLVLDVSGSMDETITSYNYTVHTGSKANNATYYYYINNTYVPVTRMRDGFLGLIGDYRWYYWVRLNRTELPSDAVIYDRTVTTTTKIAALKQACKVFIANVAAQSTSSVTHRISIVKFAGTKSNTVGNQRYGSNNYNYSQVVLGLTDAKSSTLNSTIDALVTGGATQADYGMQHAVSVLNNARANSDKLVVMFTDGSPTSSNGFENNVANGAVTSAKTLKSNGVKVYTVGVFGANPGDNVNRYMSAVSSDKPTASQYTDGSSSNPEGEGFYMTATDASELENIFATISTENTTGGTTTTLTATNSSVRDFVTPQFKLASGSASDIALKLVPSVTANTTETVKWGTPVENPAGISATIGAKDADGNTPVIVTGFDFTNYWVGPNRTNGVVTDWNAGAKLVIEITIVQDPEAGNAGGVFSTNTDSSGIYYGEGQEADFKPTGIEFPVPQAVNKANAYLHIVKEGLDAGENAIFDIKLGDSVINTVMINSEVGEAYVLVDWLTAAGKSKNFTSASPLVLSDMIQFTVVERADWSWNAPNSTSSQPHALYKNVDGSWVEDTFSFTIGDAKTTVSHDETSVVKTK